MVSSSWTPGRETLRKPNLAFLGGHASVGVSQPTAEDFSPPPSDTAREDSGLTAWFQTPGTPNNSCIRTGHVTPKVSWGPSPGRLPQSWEAAATSRLQEPHVTTSQCGLGATRRRRRAPSSLVFRTPQI